MKFALLALGVFLNLLLSAAWISPVSAGGGLKAWPLLDPEQRFVLYGPNQDLVFDRTTGLLWERSPSGTSAGLWTQSVDLCFQKSYPPPSSNGTPLVGSMRGWRLPTVEELSSIQTLVQIIPHQGPSDYVYGPASNLFQNVSGAYWSSTTYPFSGVLGNPDEAYSVGFGLQNSTPSLFAAKKHGSSSAKAWCVYGGSNNIAPVQFESTL